MTETPEDLRAQARRLDAEAVALRAKAREIEQRQEAERMRANERIPVDRSARVLTDGAPVPEDGSHTEDRGDGQQKGYVVLSGAERAKGFVRPVRTAYRHVGGPRPASLRDLTPEEAERYGHLGYVKVEDYGPEMAPKIRKFWTERELRGGCGTVTTMGMALAETYARDPGFYSGTYCCGCGAHYPVGAQGEFVWEGTDERVGT